VTSAQSVDLMQAFRAVAEPGPGLLAMEVFKVQVDLTVKVGRENGLRSALEST
jgi:hypothetical protein